MHQLERKKYKDVSKNIMKTTIILSPKRGKKNQGYTVGRGEGHTVGIGKMGGSDVKVVVIVGKKTIISHMTEIIVDHMTVIIANVVVVILMRRNTNYVKEKSVNTKSVVIAGKGIVIGGRIETDLNDLKGVGKVRNQNDLGHILWIVVMVVVSIGNPKRVVGVQRKIPGQVDGGRRNVVVRSPVVNTGLDQGGKSFYYLIIYIFVNLFCYIFIILY